MRGQPRERVLRTLLYLLCSLSLALPALADDKELYLRALAGVEEQMPPEAAFAAEKNRLEAALEPLLFAYLDLYPNALLPRVRLLVGDLERGAARSLDTGLILVNPYLSARLSDPVLAGLLAHEMAHIALGHGWARTQVAFESVSGTHISRLAMAMKGLHPLKGSQAWSELQHTQEFEADNAGRRLLVAAGLPAAWLGETIAGVADNRATESHPSANQRLLALASH